ncbi:putative formin-like protein 11-like [Capsicum annuum]|nr:putative formin-like protein 11-like [Capsicum annuum]
MEMPEENNVFQHFSHRHQLLCINKLPPKGNAICSGCKLSILPGKFHYKCERCSFFLHQGCFNMPKNLQHLVDPIHHLTLLATPSSSIDHYSGTKCNACGKDIAGFCYACAKCSTYYHTLCLLALPLSMELPSHCHKLDLEFCPPYDFKCDLCKKPSYKGWLYHCSSCEFDAHISCAITHQGADIENQCKRKTEKTGDKCHELMELLSIYMKGSEEINVRQEISSQDQLQHPAQQTPSYQSSDGCFSIDLAKPQLLHDEQTGSHMRKEAVQIPGTKEKSNIAYITLPKGAHLPSSNEIGSEVWMELGKEMEKAYQTNDSNKEHLRSSCCPDILKSLFCLKR